MKINLNDAKNIKGQRNLGIPNKKAGSKSQYSSSLCLPAHKSYHFKELMLLWSTCPLLSKIWSKRKNIHAQLNKKRGLLD